MKDNQQQHYLIPAMAYDNGKSGIAEYTNRLVEALSSKALVTVCLLEKDKQIFPLSEEKNISFIYANNIFSNPVMNIIWHLVILPFLTLNTKFTDLLLPALNRRATSFSALPTIGIAHDLSQFNVSNKYDLKRMIYVKAILPVLLRSVNHVIAISKNTRKDLLKHWDLNSAKISVCYNGYNQSLYREIKPDNLEAVLTQHDLKRPYLLYVSRVEHPGKNHARLIRAFEQLSPEIREKYDLVFAGSDWNGAEVVKEIAKQSRVSDRIRFLGFVATEDLPGLYHGAALNALPSLYEGFGIPLIEGMACGTPSICSNNSSLGEIAGDAALTFNPKKVGQIIAAIETCLENTEQQKTLVDKGLKHCKQFSWAHLAAHINQLGSKTKGTTKAKNLIKNSFHTIDR